MREELTDMYTQHSLYFLVSGLIATLAIAYSLVHHTHKDASLPASHLSHHSSQIEARWIPTTTEQREMKGLLRNALHTIHLSSTASSSSSSSPGDIFSPHNALADSAYLHVQALYGGSERGHTRLPDEFYDGVHIAVSKEDFRPIFEARHNEEGKHQYQPNQQKQQQEEGKQNSVVSFNSDNNDELRAYLESSLSVKPLNIYDWQLTLNGTAYSSHGFVCHYPIEGPGGLKDQGKFSRGQGGEPNFEKPVGEIEKAARHFNQLAIYTWYPLTFGPNDQEDDQRKHMNIIQEVIAVRSGLQEIGSKSVVWRRDHGVWED